MPEFLKYKIPHDLDSPERTVFHREIIRRKPFLRKLYEEWYSILSRWKPILPQGKLLEIGSGGGFLKEIEPSVICSDVLDLPGNDMTFSALQMPFANEEISCIFMIDTFHHIPDAAQFLGEAARVLAPGGAIIMIEPANSLWGRFIYQNFHHEPFEPSGGWTIPSSGPMSGANGALPWIVFSRDAETFRARFPGFQLEEFSYHTPLRYLLSGGVSFRQIVPGFTYGFFRQLDRALAAVWPQLSMFVTIRLTKKK